MADATLTDVVKKLEEVKSTVKGDEVTKATTAATVPIDIPPAADPDASSPAADPSAGVFSSLGALSLPFSLSTFSEKAS